MAGIRSWKSPISRLAGVLRMAQVSTSTPFGLRQRSQMPAKANTGRSSTSGIPQTLVEMPSNCRIPRSGISTHKDSIPLTRTGRWLSS